ncbi:MAG: hypothetical protein HY057_01465 [Rhodospirillales bacterium]|nr:hypothetical protein [Rhodospirillales bacterium]
MAETKRERRSIHRALHRVLGGNLQLRLVLAALFVGAASTWLFAELGEEIWFHEALVAIELRVLTWIEALRTLDGNAFFRLVTRFGDPLTVMAVVAVALAILALYRRYVEAAILAAGIVGSGAMVEAAKWLIHRERPPAAVAACIWACTGRAT